MSTTRRSKGKDRRRTSTSNSSLKRLRTTSTNDESTTTKWKFPDEAKVLHDIVDVFHQPLNRVSLLGGVEVTKDDFLRLSPRSRDAWLNDAIINFYGQLIVKRASDNPGFLKVHYFSTHFWTILSDKGYKEGGLAKWTKNVDIFSKDIIILAVLQHNNEQWTSAAIDFKQKRIVSCSSEPEDKAKARPNVFNTLRTYLNEEHRDKKNEDFDFTEWENSKLGNYPRQDNEQNSGVFTCTTLEYLSRGKYRIDFTQKEMPFLRHRMMLEIRNTKLEEPL